MKVKLVEGRTRRWRISQDFIRDINLFKETKKKVSFFKEVCFHGISTGHISFHCVIRIQNSPALRNSFYRPVCKTSWTISVLCNTLHTFPRSEIYIYICIYNTYLERRNTHVCVVLLAIPGDHWLIPEDLANRQQDAVAPFFVEIARYLHSKQTRCEHTRIRGYTRSIFSSSSLLSRALPFFIPFRPDFQIFFKYRPTYLRISIVTFDFQM